MNDVIEQYQLQPIFQALDAASLGDRAAAQQFFELLLNSPLYVPERRQSQPLSDSPAYPDELLNILGIQDKDRVVVPAFTSPELIQEWCGNELTYRELSGSKLLALLPDEWWLAINSGQVAQKELSPWEINELKLGQEGIPSVLAELFSESFAESLRLRPLEENESQELFAGLRKFASDHQQVKKAYLLMEEEKLQDDLKDRTEARAFLLGLELSSDENKQAISKLAEEALAPLLIGGLPLKVLTATQNQKDPMFGFFQSTPPAYESSVSAENGSKTTDSNTSGKPGLFAKVLKRLF